LGPSWTILARLILAGRAALHVIDNRIFVKFMARLQREQFARMPHRGTVRSKFRAG
jgi:hypothetical protein